MKKNEFMTIPELAKILGVSRIAVYKKIKKGEIKARQIGKIYVIPQKYLPDILGKTLTKENKKEIDRAVAKTVREYGQVLKLLGRE